MSTSSASLVALNSIVHGDCIQSMNQLPAGSVDLAFADPPFNIGFTYDVYSDSLPVQQYVDWSSTWMSAVHRALKPNGTFWLAIGDEYAAELKIEAQRIGFHCRSWVIWYYTFGVNCSRKFTRSHAHIFHFVKDPANFVFRADAPENRVPSARQLVYNDNRANPKGRLPDDTWIIPPADAIGELSADDDWLADVSPPSDDTRTWTLRPQDLATSFRPNENTWYFPRVAGTFKERAGFHGCQMPEQLLGRIVRACSEEGAVVMDPFSGSATTAAVAKKLGRQYLAFDLSEEYVKLGLRRLESIQVGDPLDGSAEPLVSSPKTTEGKARAPQGKREQSNVQKIAANRKLAKAAKLEQTDLFGDASKTSGSAEPSPVLQASFSRTTKNVPNSMTRRDTLKGVTEAFGAVYDGYSADRLVADPVLNAQFISACQETDLPGDAYVWNMLLFGLRKTGKLVEFPTTKITAMTWDECDSFVFASEIALQKLLSDQSATSLDDVLCHPDLSRRFDEIAASFAPGFTPLQYRWAALKLRKQAKIARTRAASLSPEAHPQNAFELSKLDAAKISQSPGVYLVGHQTGKTLTLLYVGETLNLRSRIEKQFAGDQHRLWQDFAQKYSLGAGPLQVWFPQTSELPNGVLAWQTCYVQKYQPKLNLATGL